MSARAALTAGLAVLLATGAARAQGPPARDAQASAWIDEGIRLRAEHRDADALDRFSRAWEATRSPEALAQRALAAQALGRWVEAERDLLAALAAPPHPWIARHRGALDGALAEIRRHLGSVDVRAAAPGASARINGSDALPLPLASPRRVVIGSVRVEVSAEGYATARRDLDVRPGDDLLEHFELVPAPAAPAPAVPATVAAPVVVAPPVLTPHPAPPAEAPASPLRAWGVRLLVAGGGLVALGGAALVWRELAAAEFNARREPPCDDAAAGAQYGGPLCASLRQQVDVAEGLAAAGFIAGGLAAAAGLALVLAAPAAPRRAVLACAPGPRSLACALTF